MRILLAFFEPFVLMLVGTVALATVLPAGGTWAGVAEFAAEAGIVTLFFLNGAKLSRRAIVDGVRHWRLHATTLGITYVLFPVIGLIASSLHLLPGELAAGLLFLSLLPSTVQSSIAFTAIAGGNVAAAVCSAAFSNLLGIVLTPLLVAMLMQGAGDVAMSWGPARSILLQLVLPFAAGHLLRPAIGGFVARRKALVSAVDRGSILLVVYSAFSVAVLEGLWTRVSAGDLALIALVCAVVLAIVLVATSMLGKALGFTREDRVVLLFCGSKKSLATGVPIAGLLFPPASVGLIILPVMLFHQIQLIVCAMLARRMGEEEAPAGR